MCGSWQYLRSVAGYHILLAVIGGDHIIVRNRAPCLSASRNPSSWLTYDILIASATGTLL
jgi:hypothetical protein